jgi:hypothetical protein
MGFYVHLTIILDERKRMERLKIRAFPDPQQDIIERYCAEAKQLLDRATSEAEAQAIRTRVCSQLAHECDSPLIMDATKKYVDQVIQRMWTKSDRMDKTW